MNDVHEFAKMLTVETIHAAQDSELDSELGYVEGISHTEVRTILKKNELKPHLKRTWCLGKLDSRFLARMETILALYALPYDPDYPVVCFDERPCFLIGDAV